MSRAWPGRICRLLKTSIFLSICTIFWSHQFVRNLVPSVLQFFVAFHVEKIYPTCSRRGCALLYRWFSGPWWPGPFPSRPIYQRARMSNKPWFARPAHPLQDVHTQSD